MCIDRRNYSNNDDYNNKKNDDVDNIVEIVLCIDVDIKITGTASIEAGAISRTSFSTFDKISREQAHS